MRSLGVCSLALVAVCLASGGARAGDCEAGEFSSTYELIQRAIFENRGCTNDLCHGNALSGGLDLRAGASYDALVDVDAATVLAHKRVVAGQKDQSLLWINLAAKTYPTLYEAPLRPMPLDPIPALSDDELEAVRLWIERGAPRTGVIPGTDTLLNACLPPPEPLEAKPLPPPAPGTGVQIRMPKWILEAQTEHEVCFASYYNVTDQVPAEFRGPSGRTFRYKRNQVRQDPLSHHLIVNLYTGQSAPTSPVWGAFKCRGGARDGETCNPVDVNFCGADSGCGTTPIVGIACINHPPFDGGAGLNSNGISGAQETAYEFTFFDGVYGELPLEGMIMWNSHAFNLTDKAGKLEAWLNFDFAAPEEQQTPAQGIFNTQNIFKMNVPVFTTQEICDYHQFPSNAQLYELSSHAHQRNKRFRIFDGRWFCADGPRASDPCSPMGVDFDSPDLCEGAECVAYTVPHVGDCNLDRNVTVDEVISGVNIALDTFGWNECPEMDGDANLAVTVDELVRAVSALLDGMPAPTARDADESLMYTNFLYNDPVILRYDPPKAYPASHSMDDLAITYCALYDNGFVDPATVKKKSTSPPPPFQVPGVGGPCRTPTGCTAGRVGELCSGTTDAQRNASCDSATGAGDGVCDGCQLVGGVTTEDEMFVLLGQYFVP